MENSVKYFVTHHPAEWGLPEDVVGTLYVAIMKDGTLFWFDNFNQEWHKSIYMYDAIVGDSDFKQVSYFDNGYITTDDARDHFEMRGIVAPKQTQQVDEEELCM